MRVFLVKVVNRSYINVMRIRKMLIYCVKLDHALYSINCDIYIYTASGFLCIRGSLRLAPN